MLIIRPAQMQAFQGVADDAFVRRLSEFIRGTLRDLPVRLHDGPVLIGRATDETLRRLVRTGMERARGYGMTSEVSLTTFVLLMFAVAPNFDAHPLIRRTLEDARVPPDARFAELWKTVTPANLGAAKELYDPQAWEADAGGF
jgi:hypothetical protein